MDSLYQRLKELDSDSFEHFCLDLLKARHPGIEIRHVDGRGGDEGIDHFEGDLDGNPTVWQCKAFRNGVREAQKRQIRDSLSRAIRTCSPRRWILCINIDLDAKAHRWYQALERQYMGKVELGLLQASDIVPQLAHYRTVCNQYFPSARLDVEELRALIVGTGDLSEGELKGVTEENIDQLLRRFKDRDARFNYEITRSLDHIGDRKVAAPGEVFSITTGSTTVRAFARDREALRLAPPQGTFEAANARRA